MLAIRCEMVTCENGSEAVVRVAAVDRDLKVVLDNFVKPSLPVIDYKTDITGVTAEDLEKETLSVADIQKKLRSVEGRSCESNHNCVHDAAAAMKLVLAVVEKGAETSFPPTEKMLEVEKTMQEAKKASLYLHRIPHSVPSEELNGVITGDFKVEVKPPKNLGPYYSAEVVFSSQEEANQAFDNVDGDIVE
ncbi:hypothetical protein BRARA_K01851, partial [Brassica rapa]